MTRKINLSNGTKATNLENYQNRLRESYIEPFFYFTVSEWENNRHLIIQEIQLTFEELIVVRSSCSIEDTIVESHAGEYESILAVSPKNTTQLINAIVKVIKSYSKNNFDPNGSHVLIQKQTRAINISGVIFTHGPKNGTPFYVINYDDQNSRTDTVTSGQFSKIIRIYRHLKDHTILPKEWQLLLKATKEIEKATTNRFLDIEFAITNQWEISIFQVRPLIIKAPIKTSRNYSLMLEEEKRKYKKSEYLSNMAFWNPAEIIGEKPQLLALSLYNELVLDKSWNEGIIPLGYTKLCRPLGRNIGGRCYVDVRTAFLSLIPQKIPVKLKNKIVDCSLRLLRKHPEFHDKVEFKIIPNCYNFTLQKHLDKKEFNTLTQKEKLLIQENFKKQTLNLINNWKFKSVEIREISKKSAHKYANKLKAANSPEKKLALCRMLFEECRDVGVIKFAESARIAFIGKSLLESLMEAGYISKLDYTEITGLIKTIATNFINSNHQKDETFDHLRAGSYNITELPYFKQPYFNENIFKANKIENEKSIRPLVLKKISKACKDFDFKTNGKDIINFALTALADREYIKLLFTKNLSEGLEILADLGEEMNLSREQLSYLTFDIIKTSKRVDITSLKKNWLKHINKNLTMWTQLQTLPLPDCIFSTDDFYYIKSFTYKPNYITKNTIEADCYTLSSQTPMKNKNLIKGKIIILENADPGYDWIFACDIRGLITKYGGVASHMAIRCNEFNLPAILGCGEEIFNKITLANRLKIDCKQCTFKIIC